LLDHRKLIVAHRHVCGPERRDIGGLADWIGQEPGRDIALEAAQTNLFFDGRVALQARDGD
jgi:hypothetical protein